MVAPPSRPAAAPAVWVRADVVRVVGLAAVAAAVLWFDGVAVALMLLVLGGLMVPRALRIGPRLDVAYGVALLVAAWSGVLDFYRDLVWWDLVVHAVVTGLVAAVSLGALVRLGAVRDPDDADLRAHRLGVALVTVAVGLGLSVVWEIAEWLGHTYVDPAIYVTETDTLGDLLAGGLGSLVAGAALIGRQGDRTDG
ncbi:hypothetical protein [Cellulomonas aerilata]|uniref:hypothetical protein n=1 Tax=Cellulomonas aerilata TaxID=515326 RepID=UPI0011BF5C2E|nr:hypothetical protein [Cellulomonas aerilata]